MEIKPGLISSTHLVIPAVENEECFHSAGLVKRLSITDKKLKTHSSDTEALTRALLGLWIFHDLLRGGV